MPLPPLATVADFSQYIGQDLDQPGQARALRILGASSARIRGYCRQVISLVEDETVTLRIIEPDELVLPQRPVVSVSSVVVNNIALADWVLRGDKLLRRYGWNFFPGVHPLPDPRLVTVTYSHGYAEIPEIASTICMEISSMTFFNAQGLRQESIDDYSRTWAIETVGAGALTKDHKKLLSDIRRSSGSVHLGHDPAVTSMPYLPGRSEYWL